MTATRVIASDAAPQRSSAAKVTSFFSSLRNLTVGLGLLGTVIALAGSWIPSLWGDEAASVMSAERPLPTLLQMLTHVDAVHGTYYLGLKAWVIAFGASPFAVRLPSALAVGLTIAAVVLIVDRLGTRKVAIVAGVICCALPRVTYMGEEARSYAFSAAIAAWLIYLLLELMRRPSPSKRLWLAYGILLAVGIYVFLYVALFALVHAIILIRARAPKRMLVTWLRVVICSVLAASPLLFFAYAERTQIAYLSNQPQVNLTSIGASLWFGNAWFAVLAWLLIAVALIAAYRGRRKADRGDDAVARESALTLPRLEFLAVVWLAVPTLFLVLSQYLFADFTARYLSFCAPAAGILIACGLAALSRNHTRVLAVATVLVLAAATPIYLSQRGPYSKNNSDWAQISAVLGAHASAGDAVAFDETARPSRRPRLAMHTYPAGFTGLEDVTLRVPFTQSTTWYDHAYSIDQAYEMGRFEDVRRVWLIEYATASHVDTYGIDPLQDHGYHEAAVHYRTHSGMIYLFTR